ncbi:probable ATP-dependent RNA helicase DDX20 [Hydractinia symbiolongicarpus]|uniref:probable ATP-dependent RNA helicase DDX20 n=1 Tax=Hydractinia symbiolongicarpus TaxID=13093 RepID=UPI00254D7309|nr:probable ATP-dependent RNA helicase DDX20 [Hydractinia symbiolongicarpus]
MSAAHVINAKKRTIDVFTETKTNFESLLLSPKVLSGLKHAGFCQPSPIQLEAIPLAKCGLDLICQAKSGTGKTCVFAVCALEAVDVKSLATQVLVLAPTREIAHQIFSVVSTLSVSMEHLHCSLFIGGIPVEKDIKNAQSCHIAIGTPGRIRQLIQEKHIRTQSIRLFVLDEADKLLEEGSFQEQINWIFSTLGTHKQVLALSATYPEYLASYLENYMQDPVHVRINPKDVTLKGIRQYYKPVSFHPLPHKAFQEKCSVLLEIIRKLPFQQCMIFSNYQTRAEHLCKTLNKEGWPCTYIAGSQVQTARLHAMNQLKNYNCRILITTDLTSRGIDCDKVNLVINLDLPWDTDTYLHRIGRAGRFGSYGVAISIVTEGDEYKKIFKISHSIGRKISPLPENVEKLNNPEVEEKQTIKISEIEVFNERADESDAQQANIKNPSNCNHDESKLTISNEPSYLVSHDNIPSGTTDKLIISSSVDKNDEDSKVNKSIFVEEEEHADEKENLNFDKSNKIDVTNNHVSHGKNASHIVDNHMENGDIFAENIEISSLDSPAKDTPLAESKCKNSSENQSETSEVLKSSVGGETLDRNDSQLNLSLEETPNDDTLLPVVQKMPSLNNECRNNTTISLDLLNGTNLSGENTQAQVKHISTAESSCLKQTDNSQESKEGLETMPYQDAKLKKRATPKYVSLFNRTKKPSQRKQTNKTVPSNVNNTESNSLAELNSTIDENKNIACFNPTVKTTCKDDAVENNPNDTIKHRNKTDNETVKHQDETVGHQNETVNSNKRKDTRGYRFNKMAVNMSMMDLNNESRTFDTQTQQQQRREVIYAKKYENIQSSDDVDIFPKKVSSGLESCSSEEIEEICSDLSGNDYDSNDDYFVSLSSRSESEYKSDCGFEYESDCGSEYESESESESSEEEEEEYEERCFPRNEFYHNTQISYKPTTNQNLHKTGTSWNHDVFLKCYQRAYRNHVELLQWQKHASGSHLW